MADRDLSPKHRAAHGGVALESGREVERPDRNRARILCREWGAGFGADSPFVWISIATSWSDTRRRDRYGRVFAVDGWRRQFLLEEQSVFDADIHRRKRRVASAVGISRSGECAAGERDSNRLGRALRSELRSAVLDRRRSDQEADARRVGNVPGR